MPTAEIRQQADAIWQQQVDAEMSEERWSLLFLPGTYGTPAEPLQIKVGYYTEVAGLGADPSDVVINGKVEVYNRCLDRRSHAALLRRAQQLLALAVQPDHRRQRRRPGRLPGLGELLGDLAGRPRCAASTSAAATSR